MNRQQDQTLITDTFPLSELSETRRSILEIIKRDGAASIAFLAKSLGVSYETIRQQVRQMCLEGWLVARRAETRMATAGRPTQNYRLTPAGEHLFPKQYARLSTKLIDVLSERFGVEGLRAVMEDLMDAKVERWKPELTGLSLRDRLHKLQDIYLEGDPHMSVEETDEGEMSLVQRNCPFLAVSNEGSAVCSLTVSTLSHLVGHQVVREQRFQNGDGKCVFRVRSNHPLKEEGRFSFEGES